MHISEGTFSHIEARIPHKLIKFSISTRVWGSRTGGERGVCVCVWGGGGGGGEGGSGE